MEIGKLPCKDCNYRVVEDFCVEWIAELTELLRVGYLQENKPCYLYKLKVKVMEFPDEL